MNNYTSLALTAFGAYTTISGIKNFRSKDSSKSWEMAKVALGVAILANQADLAFGGEGLMGRLLNSSVLSEAEKASSSRPLFLQGSKPEDFDPTKSKVAEVFHMGSNADATFDPTQCNLDQVDQILSLQGEDTPVSRLFQVLNETKGISCKNFLPWKDAFHRGGTGYIDGIRPKDLSQSVMWGIDRWKRPFVAIKHTCDKVSEGAIAFFQRYTGMGIVVSGGHFQDYNCSPSSYERINIQWLRDLFDKGVAQVPQWKDKTANFFLA